MRPDIIFKGFINVLIIDNSWKFYSREPDLEFSFPLIDHRNLFLNYVSGNTYDFRLSKLLISNIILKKEYDYR